jgi:hypothetical protein
MLQNFNNLHVTSIGMTQLTMFRWGFCDDIKTLLLNLPKPTTLSEAIIQAIDYDNRLFE